MQQPQIPWQQPQTTPSRGVGRAALQYGFIFGGSVGLIDVIYTYFLDNGTINWYENLVNPLLKLPLFVYTALGGIIVSMPIYILLFVGYLLAGVCAARKSKRVASGTLAGLLVGVIFLLVDFFIGSILLTVLVLFPQIAAGAPQTAGVTDAESSILISTSVYSLVAGLILIGIGALIGFLGGLIGKGTGTQPQPYLPYAPNPYGQPIQPGQPGPIPPYPPISGQ